MPLSNTAYLIQTGEGPSSGKLLCVIFLYSWRTAGIKVYVLLSLLASLALTLSEISFLWSKCCVSPLLVMSLASWPACTSWLSCVLCVQSWIIKISPFYVNVNTIGDFSVMVGVTKHMSMTWHDALIEFTDIGWSWSAREQCCADESITPCFFNFYNYCYFVCVSIDFEMLPLLLFATYWWHYSSVCLFVFFLFFFFYYLCLLLFLLLVYCHSCHCTVSANPNALRRLCYRGIVYWRLMLSLFFFYN